jgi:hypothetical protein
VAYIIDRIAGRRRPATVAGALARALARTRFVCTTRLEGPGVVRLDPIRLFEKKDHCGNHPGPCPLRGAFARPHKEYRYLEGADWVSFNDRINTILDRLCVSADVGSSLCVVRIGRRRRVNYGQQNITFAEWVRVAPDDEYQDWCGRKAPPSTYPEGTPGYYGISRAGQRRYARHGLPAPARR